MSFILEKLLCMIIILLYLTTKQLILPEKHKENLHTDKLDWAETERVIENITFSI